VGEEGFGGGLGVGAAGADADDAVGGFDDVAGAAGDEAGLAIYDGEHGFEASHGAVGAPVLGELDDGAAGVVGELGELFLEAFEEGEGVGGAAGEADEDLAAADAADLGGVVLDDGVAEGDLAVTAEGDLAVAADGEDGGGSCGLGHEVPSKSKIINHEGTARRHEGTEARRHEGTEARRHGGTEEFKTRALLGRNLRIAVSLRQCRGVGENGGG